MHHPKHSNGKLSADELKKILIMVDELVPHRGLPPCRGGWAYAPMTRTIIQSEGEELTKRRPPDRNNHTTRH